MVFAIEYDVRDQISSGGQQENPWLRTRCAPSDGGNTWLSRNGDSGGFEPRSTRVRALALSTYIIFNAWTENRVRFEIALSRKDRTRVRHIEALICRRSVVKSSLGDTHERIFVKTPILLAGVRQLVEVGLISREEMRSRMLIGRNALQGRYLVDPQENFLWPPLPRPRD